MLGSSETISSTLTNVLDELARNPDHVLKLREEITPLMNENGSIAHNSLQNLKYLNAIINETLRLFPTAGIAHRRKTPPEGIQIGEIRIPGDMVVFCPQYVISRSE